MSDPNNTPSRAIKAAYQLAAANHTDLNAMLASGEFRTENLQKLLAQNDKLQDTLLAMLTAGYSTHLDVALPALDTQQFESVPHKPVNVNPQLDPTYEFSAAGDGASKLPVVVEIVKPSAEEVRANPLHRLLGEQSPVYDIFASSPIFAEGRGSITAGSRGWQWHKETDIETKSPSDRSKLPEAFYGGLISPKFALIRLQSTIVILTLPGSNSTGGTLADRLHVFIVGLSDADPTAIRWLKAEALTTSYATRVLRELDEYVLALK